MIKIRAAIPTDLEDIWKIEKEAFSKYLNINFQHKFEHLKLHFELSNGGVFVAENETEIVGFILSRTLGKVGWIGTFAVKTTFQNSGIGKKLLTQAINFLESKNCELIGLETLNSAYGNIEFYLKNGFSSVLPSFQLVTETQNKSSHNYRINFDETLVTYFSNKVLEGNNAVPMFKSALFYKWGESIEFINKNEVFGIGLLEYKPKFESEKLGTLTIHTLILSDTTEERIIDVFDSIHSYASQNGFSHIEVFINSQNSELLRFLISNDFHIKNSRIRMLYKGSYKLNGIECSRWIM